MMVLFDLKRWRSNRNEAAFHVDEMSLHTAFCCGADWGRNEAAKFLIEFDRSRGYPTGTEWMHMIDHCKKLLDEYKPETGPNG